MLPALQVLGKKLGKAVGKVKAALAAMTPEDIAAFERDGCAEVAGERLAAGDIRVSPLPCHKCCLVLRVLVPPAPAI